MTHARVQSGRRRDVVAALVETVLLVVPPLVKMVVSSSSASSSALSLLLPFFFNCRRRVTASVPASYCFLPSLLTQLTIQPFLGTHQTCIAFHCDGGYATSTSQVALNALRIQRWETLLFRQRPSFGSRASSRFVGAAPSRSSACCDVFD